MKILLYELIELSPKVKLPIACALHEIAKIVGPEETNDLFNIVRAFVKDEYVLV